MRYGESYNVWKNLLSEKELNVMKNGSNRKVCMVKLQELGRIMGNKRILAWDNRLEDVLSSIERA